LQATSTRPTAGMAAGEQRLRRHARIFRTIAPNRVTFGRNDAPPPASQVCHRNPAACVEWRNAYGVPHALPLGRWVVSWPTHCVEASLPAPFAPLGQVEMARVDRAARVAKGQRRQALRMALEIVPHRPFQLAGYIDNRFARSTALNGKYRGVCEAKRPGRQGAGRPHISIAGSAL
jgi:hypothetical protein